MIKKKRFLFVLPNTSLGGAEQVLKMIAEHHYNKKNDVVVFFLCKKEKNNFWEESKYSLNYSLFDNKILSLMYMFFIFTFFKKNIYWHSVYTSHIFINSFVSLLIKFKIIRTDFFIARESTSVFSRYKGKKLLQYKLLYRLGYSNMNLIICQTQFMKTQLINNLKWIEKNNKIKVISNPININKLDNEGDFNHNTHNKFIVSAGRLIPEKGFDILINAFDKIIKQNQKFHLVILGEGYERQYLENLIEKLGLQQHVFLLGHVKNVYPYFKNAQLCVVSSRIEGFPNVLLQMMSQNDKIVSTLCAGGIEEIPGIYKVAPNDIALLHNAMDKALKIDTSNNRPIFDQLLKERSIENFVATIDNYLKNV